MFESEERRVAERIKDYIKKEGYTESYEDCIMLRNGRILNVVDYLNLVSRDKINPMDTYTYIRIDWGTKTDFYYPLLDRYGNLVAAYLSKLGFYYGGGIVPATGLKYATLVERYENYLSIEVVNLDTAVNNTNLRKIVVEVLGGKLVSGEKKLTGEEYKKIYDTLKSQRLFAGHNFEEAWNIILEYYDEGKQSLAKEVVRIAADYYKIFNPYTVCYDMKTWDEVDCWKIKL